MKNNYFSYLKSVAIFFVVAIHLNNLGFNYPQGNVNFNFTGILRVFALPAVPIFLAISGYFTQNSNKSYVETLKKQIPRILIPYLIWGFIYSIYNVTQGINFNKIIFEFFTFQTETPFYFVFLILIYYIVFPLISWFSNSKIKTFIAFLISFMMSLWYQYYSGYKNNSLSIILYLGNPFSFFIYPVLGSYLNKNREVKTSLFLIITFFLLSLFESILLLKLTSNISTSFSAIKPFNIIYCFYLIIWFFQFKNFNINESVISKIGDRSYFIYFSHISILILISKLTNKLNILNQFFLIIITPVILYFLGFLLKKILGNKALNKLGF